MPTFLLRTGHIVRHRSRGRRRRVRDEISLFMNYFLYISLPLLLLPRPPLPGLEHQPVCSATILFVTFISFNSTPFNISHLSICPSNPSPCLPPEYPLLLFPAPTISSFSSPTPFFSPPFFSHPLTLSPSLTLPFAHIPHTSAPTSSDPSLRLSCRTGTSISPRMASSFQMVAPPT